VAQLPTDNQSFRVSPLNTCRWTISSTNAIPHLANDQQSTYRGISRCSWWGRNVGTSTL